MTDIAALATLLNTDARYDADVRAGNNGRCGELVNETNVGGATRWNDVPVEDFLAAIADDVLTTAQSERIALYIEGRTSIPASHPGVIAWIQANLSTRAKTELRAIAEREETHGEAGDVDTEVVSLSDVRRAVRRVAKSHIVASGQADLET